ncbi:domain K- type RNA binding proteins family protein [Pelomyxa schiedti]|nr:domain K- type RNA binding proteins family protein [Pelomyxa schiedti]
MRKIEEEWDILLFFITHHTLTKGSKVETLAIFGDRRGRRGAELKLMSAIEQKRPGHYTHNAKDTTCDDEWGTETLLIPATALSYILGKRGSTKRKIAHASGSIIEYVGSVAYLSGYRAERQRAREYLLLLMEQRLGPVHVETHSTRRDCTYVDIPTECVGYVTGLKGRSLRSIEESTDTFCFIDGGKSGVHSDTERLLIFGFVERGRMRAQEMVMELIKQKLTNDREARGQSLSGSSGGLLPAPVNTSYAEKRMSPLSTAPPPSKYARVDSHERDEYDHSFYGADSRDPRFIRDRDVRDSREIRERDRDRDRYRDRDRERDRDVRDARDIRERDREREREVDVRSTYDPIREREYREREYRERERERVDLERLREREHDRDRDLRVRERDFRERERERERDIGRERDRLYERGTEREREELIEERSRGWDRERDQERVRGRPDLELDRDNDRDRDRDRDRENERPAVMPRSRIVDVMEAARETERDRLERDRTSYRGDRTSKETDKDEERDSYKTNKDEEADAEHSKERSTSNSSHTKVKDESVYTPPEDVSLVNNYTTEDTPHPATAPPRPNDQP